MRASRRGIAAALLAVAAVVGGGLWLRGQAQIDRCLDAGGRWDADRGECVGARPEG